VSPPTEKKNYPTGNASVDRAASGRCAGFKAAIETFANRIGSAPAALTAQFGGADSRSSFSYAEEKAREDELHFAAAGFYGRAVKKLGAAQRAAPGLLQDR